MAGELFDRYLRLKLLDLDATGLNATFHVVKSTESEPNAAEFKVYNLKESNRQKLHQANVVPIEISVGYNGLGGLMSGIRNAISPPDGESLMFKGDVREVYSQKEGPDWVTVLRIQDGLNAHRRARLLKSYKTGMPFSTVISDMLAAFPVDTKNALTKILANPAAAETTLSNYIVSGSVSKELEKILARLGLTYSIQEGELVVLGELETINIDAVEISPQTGLIGSPEPGVNKKKPILKMKCLIQPQLAPGKMILLNSARFKGVYKINKAVYTGSAFDNNWYVDLEATAIK